MLGSCRYNGSPKTFAYLFPFSSLLLEMRLWVYKKSVTRGCFESTGVIIDAVLRVIDKLEISHCDRSGSFMNGGRGENASNAHGSPSLADERVLASVCVFVCVMSCHEVGAMAAVDAKR